MNIKLLELSGLINSKIKSRIKTFMKHKKEGLPKEQMDLQQFLKYAAKEFRIYDRKLAAYIPKVPRGKAKQSKEYEYFLKELNKTLNTTSTYKDIKQFQNAYNKLSKKGKKKGGKVKSGITLADASLLMEASAEVQHAVGFRVGTNNFSREFAAKHALIIEKNKGSTLNGRNLRTEDIYNYYEEHRNMFENMAVNEIYNYVSERFDINGDIEFGDDF